MLIFEPTESSGSAHLGPRLTELSNFQVAHLYLAHSCCRYLGWAITRIHFLFHKPDAQPRNKHKIQQHLKSSVRWQPSVVLILFLFKPSMLSTSSINVMDTVARHDYCMFTENQPMWLIGDSHIPLCFAIMITMYKYHCHPDHHTVFPTIL